MSLLCFTYEASQDALSQTSSPTTLPPQLSAPQPELASLLFFKHGRHALLHLLPPLPGMIYWAPSLQQSHIACSLTSFRSFTKRHHPNESFPGHLKCQITCPHTHTHTPPQTHTLSSISFSPFMLFFPSLGLSILLLTYILPIYLVYWLSSSTRLDVPRRQEFYVLFPTVSPKTQNNV